MKSLLLHSEVIAWESDILHQPDSLHETFLKELKM